ncbi:MAG: hypothetical protein WDO19_07450 [Bacteroidota bacterium]
MGYNNATFNFGTILPVTLSDFSAKAVNNTTQLNWSTETEENTSSFIIERSTDGTTFTAIGKVNATGNSSSAKNYSASDKQPADGINYYRLKQQMQTEIMSTVKSYKYNSLLLHLPLVFIPTPAGTTWLLITLPAVTVRLLFIV